MSWDLHQNKAKWHGAPWSINVDLAAKPNQPWIELRGAADQIALRFSIAPKELHGNHDTIGIPFGEAYVRQSDLIAIYPEHSPCRFGYQVDSRILQDSRASKIGGNAIGMEIWLSIQTSLLDSHPQLELKWDSAPFKKLDENCWINSSSQLGLVVHPLDKSDCDLQSTNDGLIMNVFGRFMEKGVIRRMRFLLIASPTPQPPSYWKDRFEEFSSSPLPLTT